MDLKTQNVYEFLKEHQFLMELLQIEFRKGCLGLKELQGKEPFLRKLLIKFQLIDNKKRRIKEGAFAFVEMIWKTISMITKRFVTGLLQNIICALIVTESNTAERI